MSTRPASVSTRHLPSLEHGLQRLDLLEQPVRQLLPGAHRDAGNVKDRLLGIKLCALAAGLVENVDDVGFEPCQPKLKHGEQTHGACANNHYVGGSLVGLHRLPAEKWSALIWGV
jgi:hypothetical protein